ncbi:MAG: hypothetical protein AAFQ94_29710 [Bacteroidota bacterium]
MQYACGDWVDDMRVTSVSDTAYSFMIDRDIDPEMLNGPRVVKNYFYDNRVGDEPFAYRMKGFLSDCAKNGCDGGTPVFRIYEIEKLSGEPLKGLRGISVR